MAYGLIGVLLVAYLGFLILRHNDTYSIRIDGWAVAAVEVVASLMCLARGLGRRQGKAVPLVLGAALLSWSLGDVALTVESIGGATPPSPSVADAFYLGFFPLAYVAVVLFMRGEVRRLNSPSWLDSAVAGLGAAAVCAAFAFHTLLHDAGGSSLAVATNLAYPIGDLLLLVLVVGSTTMLSGRRKAPWLLLATGLAMNVAGDTFNLFGSSAGSTHVGTVVNGIAWPTAILLMSMAVWLRPGHSDPFALQKPPGFLLPGLAATAGLVILGIGSVQHVNSVAVGLAFATLLVVGIRLVLSVSGLRTLMRQREGQSLTDDLTGLGNRRHLFHILNSFFDEEADAAIEPRRLAFLFIDLARFKEVNDSFGHPAGDKVLRHLGERFKTALGKSDALVRLGGDEFAVVLMDADADYARAIAERLTASLEEPFALDAVSAYIEASIGIALAPEHATDADELVSCADVAMYRAKLKGEPFALYDRDFDDSENLLHLAEELRVAIEQGELLLHYQPQLNVRTGETMASEALLRWSHPRLGLVPPLKFLPLAEQAGLMGALTKWVLEQALAQCAAWRANGSEIAVSVNIAPTNLLEAGFSELVRDLLERHGLPGYAVVLEITETSIITDFERAKRVIEELSEFGVVVSVDDFGMGFTSLAHLSSLAVRELKLDRTFITSLASRDLQLVRSTIELGHALGLRVVAEGVEDSKTLALLTELGCDIAQGYFIGMPELADDVAFDAATPSRQAREEAGRQAPRRPVNGRARPTPAGAVSSPGPRR
jgi:diguanylate cyclase (GGDEF)-like protein